MSENAELWSRIGNERMLLKNWLRIHNVEFDDEMDTEELRQLYISEETRLK